MEKASQPLIVSSKLAFAASLGLALCLAGCTSTTKSSSSTSTSSSASSTAPVYMAPYVSGTSIAVVNTTPPLVYSVDETNDDFLVTDYDTLNSLAPVASQTLYSGKVAAGQRGLHTLATSVSYSIEYSSAEHYHWVPTTYDPAETGGFAVELSGQAGGFVQLAGQPVAPVVNATQCPDSATHTYQFITIPKFYSSSNSSSWNPTTDTAYGSVDVSSSGSTVTLGSIKQYTLSSGTPAQTVTSATGSCGSTFFGYVTNTPENPVITDPGSYSGQTISPQAMIGIDAGNGLLVEDNGSGASGTMPNTNPALYYNNSLGAGTGAVGLIRPSSDITSAAVGAQYLGFIYSPGVYDSLNPSTPKKQSSHLASFGFTSSTLPTNCNNASFGVPTTITNVIFGGDYDPTTSTTGYGNCDVAIDLGTQSSTSNGLYPNATVYMGASYVGNTSGKMYSFSAVAIAGQINSKYAIFLLGYDNTQPWTFYLLQSN